MVWFRCLLSLAILSVIMVEAVKHYDGYKVYRLIPKTEQQLHYLRELEQNVFELDFWRGPSYVDRPVDVMVPPHLNQTFNRIFWSRSIENRVMIEDVEKLAQEDKQYDPWAPSRPSRPGTRPTNPAKPIKKPINPVLNTTRADIIAGYFDAYQTITSIYNFLNAIQSQYPSIASVYTLPTKSYQNRDMTLIKIGVNQASNTKPIIFFEGGIHAREWISPATVQCFAQVLVQGYDSNNADIVALLQKFDFYILPSTNPDGYAYTQTTRLWRKTRKPYGSCYGADPNRNWAYQFGGEGSSSNQCSETYRGPNAFSEPETKAVSDYVLTLGSRVKAYKAVHSYGQYYLFPWGWTSALTSDHTALLSLGNTAANAIKAVYGTSYTVGTSTNVLYAAAGGADDWAYGGAGVKYSYTVELRDTGSYGFQLPASQIRASCEETSQGWIAFAKALATEVKG